MDSVTVRALLNLPHKLGQLRVGTTAIVDLKKSH